MLDISAARALLARTRPTRNPEGYPEEVRAEVTALASHLLSEGRRVGGIARELGLHRSTVTSGGRLTTAGEADAACAPTRLTLVSLGGYRLEGLDLDSAVLALSRLG